MSYIVLRGCWCDMVLDVLAPIKEKSDDSKEFLRGIRAGCRSYS